MRWRLVSCRYELKFSSPSFNANSALAAEAADVAAKAAAAATNPNAEEGDKVHLAIAAKNAANAAAVYDKLTATMSFIGVDAAKLGRAIEWSSTHAESGR